MLLRCWRELFEQCLEGAGVSRKVEEELLVESVDDERAEEVVKDEL